MNSEQALDSFMSSNLLGTAADVVASPDGIGGLPCASSSLVGAESARDPVPLTEPSRKLERMSSEQAVEYMLSFQDGSD